MPPSPTLSPVARAEPDVVDVEVAGRRVLALLPGNRRARVGLVMPVLDRVVDVSAQPAAAHLAVEEAACAASLPGPSVVAGTRQALAEAARRSGAWSPPPEMCLLRGLGGVAFPLLGAAYEEGGSPVGEVPRWAAPILGSATIRAGAEAGFGARATRPVRRALVQAIQPQRCGDIGLGVIALALMGRETLEPDRLARVLGCERAHHPPSSLPDPDALRAAERILPRWGEPRCERLLSEAAQRPDGVAVLLETVLYARQLGDHGPRRLPNGLTAMHDAHRALMPSSAEPTLAPLTIRPPTRAPSIERGREPAEGGRRRTRGDRPERRAPGDPRAGRHRDAAPSPAARPAPPAPPVPHAVRAPGVGLPAVAASARIAGSDGLKALEARADGPFRFVLPRVAGDLALWGRLLGNCLGDFGPMAAAGLTSIVGVSLGNQLAYAVELTPDGLVRQFCGRGNRPPPAGLRRSVIGSLAAAGVLDVAARRNRPWLEGVAGAGPSPSRR
jgi:hypothetical protein